MQEGCRDNRLVFNLKSKQTNKKTGRHPRGYALACNSPSIAVAVTVAVTVADAAAVVCSRPTPSWIYAGCHVVPSCRAKVTSCQDRLTYPIQRKGAPQGRISQLHRNFYTSATTISNKEKPAAYTLSFRFPFSHNARFMNSNKISVPPASPVKRQLPTTTVFQER